MVVAVACNGLHIPALFAHATDLTFYRVDRGVVVGSRTIPLAEFPSHQRSDLVQSLGAQALVCRSIDGAVRASLEKNGVEVFFAQSDDPASAVREYLHGTFFASDGFQEIAPA
ncbi:NifB/NifX family molybdenum-iron cluster-binding protein [Gordonibacter sp. Marseille-P4307]|uniref:NifB/NifX family molybdenum-iron cluster-binding protein n=1 Tax=Gordonibacter sp. Marseille-P4307 TaxID=2161815 RepID=UPI000F52F815|nr:NifB/NifX family molybdenum-iron cluster-binding protein [Gordonibacter sp. Marseille-P4307]